MASPPPTSFSDFPEDVQFNVLSFLSPAEVSAFACTSRRFAALCSASASDSPVWLAMCDRRWGSKTLILSWASGAAATGRVPYARLYRTLDRWESLIGFWRRLGRGTSGTPPLVFFEWGPSYITGSRVSPSADAGTYGVLKVPFLWLGLSAHGDQVSFLHLGSRFESPGEFFSSSLGPSSDSDLVPVTVSFMGCNHFVVEENRSFYAEARGGDSGVSDEVAEIESTSPPDRLMSEIYRYFANRTSPVGDKASRRQRKKEREKLGRRRLWEAEHFVKIVNYQPTRSRPLQGLWKGIREDNVLDFYLVSYDDVGGITCKRVGDAGVLFSGYSPVFWTSNTTFLESPFSKEEQDLYGSREHIRAVASNWSNMDREVVSRILCINSSYDLVIPDLSGPRNVQGRIWEYEDGTFGFGFLRNNFIIDLKHITLNGYLLATIEYCCNHSSI